MMKKWFREFFLYPDVLVMVLLVAVGLVWTVPQLASVVGWLMLIVGMATYAMSEYVVHRFVFHMRTPKQPFLLKLIKRLHFDHHTDPEKLHLLFLPLWFSLPSFIIIGSVVYAITFSFPLTIAYLTGLIIYFLYYEWKHYIAHRPIQPLTKLGKKLKRTHLLHHFKNENYWYGVTHTSIDRTLGTFKDQQQVEKSETARKLENR
ncbi:sterol desaturase family protein [Alkalihalobacillus sp. 1P02AB]|uniref:sterol desaturase family protein n=1 Tax=Alkalihalobacillus sp. 1P02AB TaxID=3132260 RepID=UPI0039A72672